jgi:hypothetical protein
MQGIAVADESSAAPLFVLTESRARSLIAAMLGLKLLITVWNAAAYSGRSYDYDHHAARALVGGLEVGKMNYDPPLYYLPALLFASGEERKAAIKLAPREIRRYERDGTGGRHMKPPQSLHDDPIRARLMAGLRATNVLYITIFFLCWCYVIFPRLFGDWRSWFLASALLLALPGYQKLGVMSHADNLFAAASAACAAIWLVLHERWRSHHVPLCARAWLALACATGLVGLTRPFAAVPVVLFTLIACIYAVRGRSLVSMRAAASVLAVAVIAGTMSASWYAYRWKHSKAVTAAYKEGYVARYEPLRESFDYVDYFTSFRLGALLKAPHRDKQEEVPNNRPSVANSFFTLLYSETWGDHWLYFSGRDGVEGKLWAKRVLFVLALPIGLLCLIGGFRSARTVAARARLAFSESTRVDTARWLDAFDAIECEVVIAVWFALGVLLYLYWQTGPALLPGKNSTIKFTYLATSYPLGIALACIAPPPRAWFNACAAYLLAVYVVALPVAIFLPT